MRSRVVWPRHVRAFTRWPSEAAEGGGLEMEGAFGQETHDPRIEQGRSPTWAFLRDLRRVWPYVRPHGKLAVGSFVLIGVGTVASLLTPWPLAIVVDSIGGKQG